MKNSLFNFIIFIMNYLFILIIFNLIKLINLKLLMNIEVLINENFLNFKLNYTINLKIKLIKNYYAFIVFYIL